MKRREILKITGSSFSFFSPIQIATDGQATDFPTWPFSMFFFFHFQKFRWKMFGHWTLTGHSLNNSERQSEEAMVKCLHSVHQTGMKSG